MPAGSAPPSFIRMPGSSHTVGERAARPAASSSRRTNPRWSARTTPPLAAGPEGGGDGADVGARDVVGAGQLQDVAGVHVDPADPGERRVPHGPLAVLGDGGGDGPGGEDRDAGGSVGVGGVREREHPAGYPAGWPRHACGPRQGRGPTAGAREGEARDDHDEPDHQPHRGAGHEAAADHAEPLQRPHPADQHQQRPTTRPTDMRSLADSAAPTRGAALLPTRPLTASGAPLRGVAAGYSCWARLRRLPSCIAATRATGIVWPCATSSAGSSCGAGQRRRPRVAVRRAAPAPSPP